ncbi:unnamed protein product [Prorocentrum cordatum]|uniref:Uncharacterized protein n=1 Tax=Prorocentrum cordatum TaxID=2364126 RepID=A0ABN9SZT1_9DINO|nr:unnamed protein product [Polarella glacialis]
MQSFDEPAPFTIVAWEPAFFVMYPAELAIDFMGYRMHFCKKPREAPQLLGSKFCGTCSLLLFDSLSASPSLMPRIPALRSLQLIKWKHACARSGWSAASQRLSPG